MSKQEPIKIEAIVKFNQGEAFVLNRNPAFLYEKRGKFLFASDGPFFNVYEYGWMGMTGAFAGREFYIPMIDGGYVKATGQYWDAGSSVIAEEFGIKLAHVTFQTKEELKKCYVFTGTNIDLEWVKIERMKYKGCVYPYSDYEKIVKFDDMRSQGWKREYKLKRSKKNLIIEVKKKHSLLIVLTKALKESYK
ncbi:MAG: hypothetical protein PF693_09970 [Spirochaetia bacterium]|jgi:hypothetical protein|nr:hypothetical protein [Spirochaetia bacterium]